MSKFFVMVPNYWATGKSETEAWHNIVSIARSSVTRLRSHRHFMLEFPDNTKFEVSSVDGQWSANQKPIRLVSHKKLPSESVKKLEGFCQ